MGLTDLYEKSPTYDPPQAPLMGLQIYPSGLVHFARSSGLVLFARPISRGEKEHEAHLVSRTEERLLTNSFRDYNTSNFTQL